MLFQCPKLTPLQSRFLASVVALAILGLIYWSLSNPHFAYAAELDVDGTGRSREGEDHNWHRIAQQRLEDDGIEVDNGEEHIVARTVVRRAPTVVTIQGNDYANTENIQTGETTVWKYPDELLKQEQAPRGPGLPADVRDVVDTEATHAELRKRVVEAEIEETNHIEIRQDGNTEIYISVNTCLQPLYSGSGVQSAAPPQLTLYVATISSNTDPGPDADPDTQSVHPLNEGLARASVKASGDWYMSIHAPALPNNFSGVWNYELAVSNTEYFHEAELNEPNLYLIDSDTTGTLLVTNNLTQANSSQPSYQEWLKLKAPYIVFASNANFTKMMGLSHSYCGLSQNSQIVGQQDDPSGDTTNVQMQMISRGLGNKPKEQFYVTYLNSSSDYKAVLARPGNSTNTGNGVVGGGGKVWKVAHFSTKSDGNCALLFNLTFCDEVAYAVPSTPDFVSNFTRFGEFYDTYTRDFYVNFNYSLQQIPCTTTADAQYSLARNCADCAKAYKEWLCAVSIPRCEDFSSTAEYLQPRNVGQRFYNNGSFLPDSYLNTKYVPMKDAPTIEGTIAFSQTYNTCVATNQSRNPKIDSVIAPGPYKEVLPCDDLCYNLVQSCPAALGFGCPHPGRGLEVSYGTRNGNGKGKLTCNYLGAYIYTGGALGLIPTSGRAFVFAGLAGLALLVL